MEKEFLDKNVEVLISFGSSVNDSGMVPVVYRGKLLEVDKSFIKIAAFYSELSYTSLMGTRFSKAENSTVIINRDYIVYLKSM